MRKRRLWIGMGLCLLGGMALWSAYFYLFSRHPFTSAEPIEFEIPMGIAPKHLADRLKESSPEMSLPLSTLNRLIFRVYYRKRPLQAGIYVLSSQETLWEWLQKFESGKPRLFPITLTEGLTMKEMAKLLKEAQVIEDDGAFLELCKNADLLQKYQIPAHSVEGYLFPSTYFLPKNYGPTKLIEKALKTFQEKTSQELFQITHPYFKSFHDYIILASIIEKETGLTEERPRISGVFHNRLKIGMRLESDPTTIYGIENFSGNLTRNDLKTPSPYNTYVFSGLPAGPISNPGLNAIRAAFIPEKHSYLFFVSRNDGSHVFSETYGQHLESVIRYQLKRSADKPPQY